MFDVNRHIVGWLGGIAATRENIDQLLLPGRSLVFLYQGGLAECCVSSSEKERVRAYLIDMGFSTCKACLAPVGGVDGDSAEPN